MKPSTFVLIQRRSIDCDFWQAKSALLSLWSELQDYNETSKLNKSQIDRLCHKTYWGSCLDNIFCHHGQFLIQILDMAKEDYRHTNPVHSDITMNGRKWQNIRDGTIHLPPSSILSQYLGADMICIAIFLRISILQVLRFNIAMCCDFSFLFLTLDHGKKLNDALNIQTVTIKKKAHLSSYYCNSIL